MRKNSTRRWLGLSPRESSFPEERSLERGFTFKHALVRDVAYESLLLARRREWHERIARALEKDFGDIATREPDLLAYHFGEAGLLFPPANIGCGPASRP